MSRLQAAALWVGQAAALLVVAAAAPQQHEGDALQADAGRSSVDGEGSTTNTVWLVGLAVLVVGALGAGCASGDKEQPNPNSSSNLVSGAAVFNRADASQVVYDDVDASAGQRPQQRPGQPRPQSRNNGKPSFFIRGPQGPDGKPTYVDIKLELIKEAMRAGESVFLLDFQNGKAAYLPLRNYEEVMAVIGNLDPQSANEPGTYAVIDKKKKGVLGEEEDSSGYGEVYKEVVKGRPKSTGPLQANQGNESVYDEAPRKRNAGGPPELPPHVPQSLGPLRSSTGPRPINPDYQNLDEHGNPIGVAGPPAAGPVLPQRSGQDFQDYQNIDNAVVSPGMGMAYKPVERSRDYQNLDGEGQPEVFDGKGITLGRGKHIVAGGAESDEDDYVPLKDQGKTPADALYEPLENTGYDKNNQPLYAPIDSGQASIAEPTFLNKPGKKPEPARQAAPAQQVRAPPPTAAAPLPSVLGRKDKANLEAWLQENMSRDEAEAHLLKSGAVQGSYLVRKSNRQGECVISMVQDRKAFHFRILQTPKKEYYVHDEQNNPRKFLDIDQLLHFYKSHDPTLPVPEGTVVFWCGE